MLGHGGWCLYGEVSTQKRAIIDSILQQKDTVQCGAVSSQHKTTTAFNPFQHTSVPFRYFHEFEYGEHDQLMNVYDVR